MNAKNRKETNDSQNNRFSIAATRFALCGCLLLCFPLFLLSQTTEDRISFSVRNCTLDIAMEKLFEEHQVNVAFSKSELSEVDIKSYSAKNKPVSQVVSDLLKGSGFTYKKIGSQYVIRKGEEPPAMPVVERVKENTTGALHPDTIVIVDTIYQVQKVLQHDTIVKFETVLKHDTMYIVKRFWNQNRRFKANGWFLDVSAAGGNGYFTVQSSNPAYRELYELHDSAVSLRPFSNFELSAGGGHRERRFAWGASLSYRSQRYCFMLDREIRHGGHFKNDTIETYYVVNQSTLDTAFFYITDSTYLPVERVVYNYRDMNRMQYLGLNVYLAFDVIEKTYWRLFVKAGVSAEVLLSASGSVFATDAPFRSRTLDAEAAPFKASSFAGIGAGIKIYKRFEVLPEATVHYYFGSLYRSEYPVDLRQYLWNVRVGLNYYF